MNINRLRDIEGYEEFKNECDFFECKKEYPGWTGVEKYGIITDVEEKELKNKYPALLAEMSPYIILSKEFSKPIGTFRKNNNKHEKRSKKNNSYFEIDEIAESMHKELSVPDYCTTLENKDIERTIRKEKIILCRYLLSRLSEAQRRRIVMRYVLKKSNVEIATIEMRSTSSISESLKNAEKKLNDIFEKNRIFGLPNSMHCEGLISISEIIESMTNKK